MRWHKDGLVIDLFEGTFFNDSQLDLSESSGRLLQENENLHITFHGEYLAIPELGLTMVHRLNISVPLDLRQEMS